MLAEALTEALPETWDGEGVHDALAEALKAALRVPLPVALAQGVGDNGPTVTRSVTAGAGAKKTSPCWLATTSQSPPAVVAVTLAPATVHAAGVLLVSVTGRRLLAAQATRKGAGGAHTGPCKDAHVTFCATAPPPSAKIAPPTAAHAPYSDARQLREPSAPENAVCQGLPMLELLSCGKKAAPRPGGDDAAVVSASVAPRNAGLSAVRVTLRPSADKKPNPAPAMSP